MPIYKTSGIRRGDLRLFEVQHLKFKLRYKIIFNFNQIKGICTTGKLKKHNNNNYLKLSRGMAFAKNLD